MADEGWWWDDPTRVWACPCGYEGTYHVVVSHRKGWKLRPSCNGKIYPINGPDPRKGARTDSTPTEVGDEPPAHPESVTPAPTLTEEPPPHESVAIPTDLTNDEEVARLLNMQRDGQIGAAELAAAFAAGGNGHNGTIDPTDFSYHGGDGLPPGDWRLLPPGPDAQVSQARETVTLPAVVRVMYDWAVNVGWKAGDGSLSAFIWDICSDHFAHCWNKRIVVIDRSEVTVG